MKSAKGAPRAFQGQSALSNRSIHVSAGSAGDPSGRLRRSATTPSIDLSRSVMMISPASAPRSRAHARALQHIPREEA